MNGLVVGGKERVLAKPEHIEIIKQGVATWNAWRVENPTIDPDLAGARLGGLDLSNVDLRKAYLRGVDLSESKLTNAKLSDADLVFSVARDADLRNADLSRAMLVLSNFAGATLAGATLTSAKLTEAKFENANLRDVLLNAAILEGANLSCADLSGAVLAGTLLLRTNLKGATLSECRVYGVAVWDANLENAIQSNLIITPRDPIIQVDGIELAQFVYLLTNNKRIRHVIDTITSKVVLILGRFTGPRKAVLDALRDELRRVDYVPVLFDFSIPESRTTLETVSTLAHMSRFVIADLTDAKSVLQELQEIVPNCPSVAIQPLLLDSQSEPGMWDFFKMKSSVLTPVRYIDQRTLLSDLATKVIAPAEAKARELIDKMRS
jgi:uncharacterized protein YjbI with pentapeptide repeats